MKITQTFFILLLILSAVSNSFYAGSGGKTRSAKEYAVEVISDLALLSLVVFFWEL